MSHWRQRLFNFVLYLSIYVGTTSLIIDLRKRKLVKITWVRIYVAIGHFLFVSMMPYAFYHNLSHAHLFEANVVASYANYIVIVLRMLIFLVISLTRHTRDKELEQLLKEVLLIQTSYFDRFKEIPKDTTHRKWLMLICAVVFTHILVVCIDMWICIYKWTLWDLLDLYPLFGLVAVQHMFMVHHATLICYVRECLSIVNEQLRRNSMDPKIGIIFWQLSLQIQKLNKIYSPVIFWIQLSLIITNAMMGYVNVLMLSLPQMHWDTYRYLFGKFYSMLVIHMYLYFMVCNRILETTRETDMVLCQYTTQSSSQEIEKIALNRSANIARVSIYGMYDINSKTLFSILAQTLMFAIILIQGDMKRIAKQ